MYTLENNRFVSKYDGFKEISLFKVLKWRFLKIKNRLSEKRNSFKRVGYW